MQVGRIISLTTIEGIRRSIPPLANCVARHRITFSEALDLLMQGFLRVKAEDPDFHLKPSASVGRWLVKVEARLADRLSTLAAGMAEMLEREPLRRRLLAGDRMTRR